VAGLAPNRFQRPEGTLDFRRPFRTNPFYEPNQTLACLANIRCRFATAPFTHSKRRSATPGKWPRIHPCPGGTPEAPAEKVLSDLPAAPKARGSRVHAKAPSPLALCRRSPRRELDYQAHCNCAGRHGLRREAQRHAAFVRARVLTSSRLVRASEQPGTSIAPKKNEH
jgi:hypothetical protein